MKKQTVVGLFCVGLMVFTSVVAQAAEVVIYSARKEHLLKPLLDAYRQKTGVETRYLTDKAGPLLARLKAEGEITSADMLITVDAGNLWHAAQQETLAKVSSTVLTTNIPEQLRDPNNQWFGLSVRARTIVYSTERVKPGDLTTYENLAYPKWKGRLCLRTSKKVYNQSLVAMLIARHGEKTTENIVHGWVANLAVPVFSNDTKLMEAIAAGQCDVGIVNTYYFGRLQKKQPNIALALFWPNQQGAGTHINISGAGVTRHAKHPGEALKLLEWFSTPEAQRLLADLNMEYPANPAIQPHATVASWGKFKGEDLNVSLAGKYQADAVRLMDRAGYK